MGRGGTSAAAAADASPGSPQPERRPFLTPLKVRRAAGARGGPREGGGEPEGGRGD